MWCEVTKHIVIVDFGLSKEQNANQTVTCATGVIGTPMYMSPEQMRGVTREIDHLSDVWSIATIFFEVLTGSTPFGRFAGPNSESGLSRRTRKLLSKVEESEMTVAIMREKSPELPQTIPQAIQAIIYRGLEKDKKDRFNDAEEMHCALKDAFSVVPAAPATLRVEPGNFKGKPVRDWTVDEVCCLFRECKFDHAIPGIKENGIDGKTLLDLADDEFSCELKLKPLQIKRIRKEISAR